MRASSRDRRVQSIARSSCRHPIRRPLRKSRWRYRSGAVAVEWGNAEPSVNSAVSFIWVAATDVYEAERKPERDGYSMDAGK